MEKPVHFRRCHICGGLNHMEEGKVEKCDHCSRSLAPFYYFDDRFMIVPGDASLRPNMEDDEYKPIQGLTVYWENY